MDRTELADRVKAYIESEQPEEIEDLGAAAAEVSSFIEDLEEEEEGDDAAVPDATGSDKPVEDDKKDQ